MKNDELLDLVDENDEVVGTVWKSEAHIDPTKIHREVAIAVFNDKGETLVQQRSRLKTSPLAWKISAAGHIGAGEDPKLATERELFEELGLKVEAIYFKKFFAKSHHKEGTKESRFFYVYYGLVKNHPKLTLDKTEVEDTKWIRPEELFEFAKKSNWDVNGTSHNLIFEIKEILDKK